MYQYKYDKHGNVVEVRYFGADEQLKEDDYGGAIYQYKYGKYGHITKTTRLNRNNEVVFED